MHPLLQQWLAKLKIKSSVELQGEEKATFERWQGILSSGEVTVDKLRLFCESQKSLIEAQWKDFSNPQVKNDRLIAQHIVYSVLLDAIKAPASERETLEKYLQTLIAQT